MNVEKRELEQQYIDSYQRMLTVARLILKNEDEASDAVSDVFARLADGSMVLPEENPERYLMATIRNLCITRIRRMTLHERIERRLSLSEPTQASMASEREIAIEMIDYAEKAFTKQTWAVFQLRFDEGLKYKEIAEQLRISEVAVYKHLAEALKKLREKFNPTRR
jgi:RNA polymerase sigma-70 factor (ECF subfamily)